MSFSKVFLKLRYIKKNSFVTGSAIYLFSNILNAAIPFTLLPILTRYLEPSQYGQVAMFNTLVGALGAFTGLGVDGSANRKYYDVQLTQQELKQYIAACLQIIMFLGSTVFLIFLFNQEYFSKFLGLSSVWIFWSVISSAVGIVTSIRLGQWLVRKEAKRYGTLQVSQGLFNMLLSLLLVVALQKGANGRICAQIVTTMTFAVIAIFYLYRDDLLGLFSWKPKFIKEALSFGVPLLPHFVGGILLSSVDRFVINSELGLDQVGTYMVAVQLSSVMAIIFDSINKAYVPWLFGHLKDNNAAQKKQIIKNTYIYFVSIMIIAVLAFEIGPIVVKWFAGAKYAGAGEVVGWLVLGQTFNGMYLTVTGYVFYSKRTGLLSLATITSGVLNVVMLLVFIKAIGIKGAAVAYSVSMLVRFLLVWYVAQKGHPMPWFKFNTKI